MAHFIQGSANQERFLLSEAATGIAPLLPVSHEIVGPLDADRLAAALAAVVAAHPALRARALPMRGGAGIEIEISDPRPAAGAPALPERLDLADLAPVDQEAAHLAAIRARMERHDGRFCALLVRLAPERHVLTLIAHHAVLDGLSLVALVARIGEAHAAGPGVDLAPAGTADAFPPLREADPQDPADPDRAHWAAALAGVGEQPGLAAARLAGAEAPDPGETHVLCLPIPAALHEGARQAARAAGIRSFSLYADLCLRAFERLTGAGDVVMSIQSAGRRAGGVSPEVMGMFSRALILRSPAARDPLLRAQEVEAAVSGALAHEALAYQHQIALAGRAPRFALNWYPPHPGLQIAGCRCREVILVPWPTTFDVNLHVVRQGSEMELRLFWSAGSRIEAGLAGHLGALILDFLAQVAAAGLPLDPVSPGAGPITAGPITADPIMAGPPAFPRIEAAVAARAAQDPGQIVLTHADPRLPPLTRGDLGRHATALAQRLPRGGRVAILGHRGPGVVIAALAALEARCPFVMIDPCYPRDKISAMIETLDPAALVLCDPVLTEAGALLGPGRLDPAIPHLAGLALRHAAPAGEGEAHLAYFLFTSGSTGRPKCIATAHAPLLQAIGWQARHFGLGPGDRVAFLAGIGHDPALRDIFLPLLEGASLACPDPGRIFEPGYLAAWLRAERVTVAHLTPSMIRLIATGAAAPLTDLARVFIGGEAVEASVLAQLRALAPGVAVANVYGASETPQIVIACDLGRGPEPTRIPLGTPRPDVTVHLRDASGRAVGRFEPGEIVIETPFLSEGYLDPAETARAFDFDAPGRGRYRTGDMGLVDAEGRIFALGRRDDQVKINGFRVELGEVEAALRRVAGHGDCAVVARPRAAGEGLRLLGFVAGAGGGPQDDPAALLTLLRAALPGHMVPERILRLDRLPLLPSGKVDRQALKTLALPEVAPAAAPAAAMTAAEREMAELWQRVLRLPHVGVDESLFALGGDSLTAVRLALEMERSGIDPAVARAILRGATIRDILGRETPGRAAGATDTGAVTGAITGPITGPLRLRMSLHALRGLLVVLVVMGHWFPGLVARVAALEPLRQGLTPLFNLATPGFAMVFGLSLGAFMYPTFLTRPEMVRAQLRQGLGLILGVMLIEALATLLSDALEGKDPGLHALAMSFYNVLGFYALALLAARPWFAAIRRFGPLRAVGAMLALCLILDVLAVRLLGPQETTGLLQLVRLYLVAKFSVLNMSIGALAGLGTGVMLAGRETLPLTPAFRAGALALLVAGAAWGAALGEISTLLAPSGPIAWWKWLLYAGVTGLGAALFWPLVTRWGAARGGVRGGVRGGLGGALAWGLQGLASIGLLALPFFLLHGLVLHAKTLLDHTGLPDAAGLALVLGGFLALGFVAVRKMWRLYYAF